MGEQKEQTSLLSLSGVSIFIDGFSVVKELSLCIERGETVALVGESGCGKSLTAHSVLRLLPDAVRVEGSIAFEGEELLTLPEKALRRLRGNEVAMVFQEPMSSLNPVFTVGSQIAEVLETHKGMDKKSALQRAEELLKEVGIRNASYNLHAYPHQLSGGMMQRVMIAMALACNPKLIIADEPTTALDVTIQAQILDLIVQLRERHNTSMLLISHNLGVVYETSSRVYVMYLGQIVESAETDDLFSSPHHPYTKGLLASTPVIGKELEEGRLHTIKGDVPHFSELPSGCRFHTRCSFAFERCLQEEPPLKEVSSCHMSRCFLDD